MPRKAWDLFVLRKTTAEIGEVTGCYIGDLLSWVMSKAQPGNIWITVQTNINILAVATLADTACIVIPEDIKVDDMTLKRQMFRKFPYIKAPRQAISLQKSCRR